MSQLVRKTLGIMTSMAVLVTVFFVGSQSFAPFPPQSRRQRPRRLPRP